MLELFNSASEVDDAFCKVMDLNLFPMTCGQALNMIERRQSFARCFAAP